MSELKRPDGCPYDQWVTLNQKQRIDVIIMCSPSSAAKRVKARLRAQLAEPVTIKKGEGMQ